MEIWFTGNLEEGKTIIHGTLYKLCSSMKRDCTARMGQAEHGMAGREDLPQFQALSRVSALQLQISSPISVGKIWLLFISILTITSGGQS